MTTKINFSEWLEAELNQRGWRQAELVRRSGLSVGHVSRIITSQRLPGSDAIQGIARAFKMPVEDVMRQAGLLHQRQLTHHYRGIQHIRNTRRLNYQCGPVARTRPSTLKD